MNSYAKELSKEKCLVIVEWLNNKSKKIAEEKDHTQKMILNSKYTGVIKFIGNIGGTVVYKPKHTHTVTLKEIPYNVSLEGFTTRQTQGVCDLLLQLNFNPYISGTNLRTAI